MGDGQEHPHNYGSMLFYAEWNESSTLQPASTLCTL